MEMMILGSRTWDLLMLWDIWPNLCGVEVMEFDDFTDTFKKESPAER